MANQRLFITQEDQLFQGGSGNDTFNAYTGRVSAATIKGVEGKDWLYFGNTETAVQFSASSNASKIGDATAGATYSVIKAGSNWSAGAFKTTDTAKFNLTAGDLETGFIMTALTNSGHETIQKTLIAGGVGNDTISFGATLQTFSSNSVRGGQGNDLIGSFGSANDTAGVINTGLTKNLIQGGKGNDTIEFDVSAALTGSGFTVNGNSGNDSIRFSATTLNAKEAKIAGGKGNDTIDFIFASGLDFTMNGGEGNDVLYFHNTEKAEKSLIAADKDNTVTGNDTIGISATSLSGSTIIGGGGNDSIVFSAVDNSVKDLVKGGKGNDFIVLATSTLDFAGSTIRGGQGNDSISFAAADAATKLFFTTGQILAGAGDDTINLAATIAGTTAGMNGVTIEGGAGADVLTLSGVNKAGSATFLYSSLSDSTSAVMDTITLAASASLGSAAAIGSAAVNFKLSETVILANGSGNSSVSGVTAQSGLVVFSSVDQDLDARISKLDAAFTTTGTVAVFSTNGTDQYIFVQGGATDGVIRITDSALLSAGVNFGRSGTIHASGTTFGF